MTPLAARVRRYAAERGLWPAGARVVVAVSGGADSMALFEILREIAATGDVVVAGLAHFDHGLRSESADDAAFCAAVAARAGVPAVVDRGDVAGAAGAARSSVEVAGRRLRYAFLERARAALSADRIAVAHTADDQAETVLLRLLRGTGTRGLRGVLPRRGPVVRPLLRTGREELRIYLKVRDVAWREDATNSDLRQPRNRVRHDLLPRLAADYRPSIVAVLARTAEVALEDEAYLDRLAAGVARHVLTEDGPELRMGVSAMVVLPMALQRRVARLALERAGSVRSVRLADVERVLGFLGATTWAPASVAGVRVERFSENAVLLKKGSGDPPRALPIREVGPGGHVELPELGPGWRLTAEGPIQITGPYAAGPWRVVLAADQVRWPLTVRGRLPGDTMRPKGVGGSKKLQDLFVDRKVPRAERDRTPVVVDRSGRIVWVVGHAVAEGVEAVAASADVVTLTVERPEGAGPEAS